MKTTKNFELYNELCTIIRICDEGVSQDPENVLRALQWRLRNTARELLNYLNHQEQLRLRF